MLIKADKAVGVLTLTLCRGEKRNALSVAVAESLAGSLESHATDDSLRLLVLRGEGERAFASGGDLKELAGVRTTEAAARMSLKFRAVLDRVRNFPVPVVGALNGDAFGGGAELAMACDIRIAAAHARFGFLQGKLAISTAWGGGVDLIAAIGVSRALRLLGRAEILSAAQACEWGIVDAVAAPSDSFEAFVRSYVEPYTTRTPRVMRAFKALARASRDGASRSEALTIETGHFVDVWTHADHWAAVEASQGRAGKD